ncbi:MAG: TonB-dependent receptor [Bacteroidetes bacterium]|nr:TonB-dependent receptor [Bacteroidota bacterium]
MRLKPFLFWGLLLLFFSINIIPQEKYLVKGIVLHITNNSVIPGVNVLIKGLKIGTATDKNGRYTFSDIRAGKYSIRFSFIGHRSVEIEVIVPSEKAENLLITMEESVINLEDIIVTGNPFLSDPKNISQNSISLSNLDLKIKRSSSVAEMLNFQPGIAMRSYGIAPSRPVIRGLSNNRVLILEDGLRMGDLSNSSSDHAMSVDGSGPEKIEIVRGPSSLLYGSNAIGGVVNVITGLIPSIIPQGLFGSTDLSSRSVNSEFMGRIKLGYGIGRISLQGAYFNREASDYKTPKRGKVENSDFKNSGFNFGASYIPYWGLIGVGVTGYNSTYGIPFDKNSENEEVPVFIDINKTEYRFTIDLDSIKSFISSISAKGGFQDYKHSEVSKLTGEIGTRFSLKSQTLDISMKQGRIDFLPGLKGVFGIWLLNQNYKVEGEEALTPNADYLSFASYIYEQHRFGNINLQAGVRYEQNNIFIPSAEIADSSFAESDKTFHTISGSIGFVYNFLEGFSVFSNVANAFRSPTVEEIASYGIHAATGSFDIGNKNLGVENNIGFDIGLRLNGRRYSIEITGYYNSFDNYIFKRPTSKFFSEEIGINDSTGFKVFKYTQVDANLFGAELKAVYDFTNGFSITFVSDFVQGKNKETEEYLPQIPALRLSVEPRYVRDYYWFGLNLKIAGGQNKVAPNETPTAGYGIIDLYGGFKLITNNFIHSFNIRIDNLLNQPYKDHLSAIKEFAPMPGRGISINYNFIF